MIGRGELVLAAAAAWMVLWSLTVLATLLLESGPVPTSRGTVVRVRSRQGHLLWPEMPRLPARWYVAVDEGRHDRLRAYRVRAEIAARLVERQEVLVTATRWRGYVRAVEAVT